MSFWYISNLSLFFRESEPVRLLGLQLVGKLMAGIPSEKKGAKLFTLPIGQSRPLSDNSKNEITAASHLFFYTISERLFKFPLSYNLCAAFFNVLLGGTSPIKVILPTSCHINISFLPSYYRFTSVVSRFLCIGLTGIFPV